MGKSYGIDVWNARGVLGFEASSCVLCSTTIGAECAGSTTSRSVPDMEPVHGYISPAMAFSSIIILKAFSSTDL